MSSTHSAEHSDGLEAYSHVIVRPLGSQKMQPMEDIHLYRNNLTALSKTFNLLFLAVKSDIHVYQPSYPTQSLDPEPLAVLKGAEVLPGVRSAGYITPCIPHSINSLLVDYLGDEEILLSADDDGYVCLWYTSKLQLKSPGAKFDMVCFDMWFDVEESAWGLAIHRDKRLLAVSCNAKVISIFELGETGVVEGKGPGGLQKPIRIVGHTHNIPFVSFLQGDPSGRWLCATDISGHVSLLDAESGTSTYIRPSPRMGWTVNLIPGNIFKWVPYTTLQNCLSRSSMGTSSFRFGTWDQPEGEYDSDGIEIGNEFELESDHSLDYDEVHQDNDDDEINDDDYDDDDDDDDSNIHNTNPYDDGGQVGNIIAASVGAQEELDEGMHDGNEGNLIEAHSISESTEISQDAINASPEYNISDVHEITTMQILPSTRPTATEEYPSPTTFLVHTSETDIFLFTVEIAKQNSEGEIQLNELQRHIPPIPRNAMDPFVPHLFGLIQRLNMVQYIPQLSLIIVGRQDGYVVLVRLLRTMVPKNAKNNNNGEEQVRSFVHSEQVLPPQAIMENNHPVGLAGISVAPLQGWGERDRRKRGIRATLLPGSPGSIGGRWRLLLVYTNWNILAYELFTGATGTAVVLA